jgi:tetratricopeptide (TPR) repeat protein/NAD-dependent dihydropyrimidine dehydrogenase PreA subunit
MPSSAKRARSDRNAAPTAARRSLNVLPHATTIRPSRMSRRRAAVLIGVHVLIAIHIAQWYVGGSTLSPVEPSEAMEFSKHGIVNAGAIFFALAIVSTLLLGRWFCGWGCHLVALQDLSRWLLERIGIRPRPLRSGVLICVPLLAFLYMFVAPPLFSTAIALAGGRPAARETAIQLALTTHEFWATFPTWLPAILTFVVCGSVIVYMLGAKGFCSYGCPYGGIFGVVDRFAALRIRVTEDCTGSGHCTAVCTSNVRVHEEVRDYRMVVDPGCMKCLDCVSVCPNDALFVGWGAPAIAAAAAPRREKPAFNPTPILRWGLLAAFFFAAFSLFHGFDRGFVVGPADWALSGLLTAIAIAIVAALSLLRGNPRPVRELSLLEELTLAVAFLAGALAFRGLHGMVAFLFSLGIAAIIAQLALTLLQLVTRRQASFHGFRLKRDGRLLPAGGGFLGVAGVVAAFWLYGTATNVSAARVNIRADGLLRELAAMHASGHVSPASRRRQIEIAQSLIQLQPRELSHVLRAGMLLTGSGNFADAAGVYERAAPIFGDEPRLLVNRGVLAAARGDLTTAIERFSRAVAVDPKLPKARFALGDALFQTRRLAEAIPHYEAGLALEPHNVDALVSLAIATAQTGRPQDALRHAERAALLEPQRPDVQELLATLRSPKP